MFKVPDMKLAYITIYYEKVLSEPGRNSLPTTTAIIVVDEKWVICLHNIA